MNGKEASCAYSLVCNKASSGKENLVQSSNVESGLSAFSMTVKRQCSFDRSEAFIPFF